jgi:hypothetical protein
MSKLTAGTTIDRASSTAGTEVMIDIAIAELKLPIGCGGEKGGGAAPEITCTPTSDPAPDIK